jgi:RNA-directed DNA polymerase
MELSLHAYLKTLRDLHAPDEFIDTVRRNAKPLVEVGLPVILTVGQLAFATDIPYRFLIDTTRRYNDPYLVFSIRKRNGGRRYICVPEPFLLAVQRWIHEHILCSDYALARLSNNVTAFRPGSSHIINAKRHVGADCVLKLDLTRFFESISERQIYRVFRDLGYRALIAFCLSRLCTRVLPTHSDHRLRSRTKRWVGTKSYKILNARVMGHLPQGAPTSPMLANLVCVHLDIELQQIANRGGLIYTRYADDITFSGETKTRSQFGPLIAEVSRVAGRYGFNINHQKTALRMNGSRKIVTGLSIDDDVLRLPRPYKDAIRQELYYIEKHGLRGHCSRLGCKNNMSYLLRLAGRIRYIRSIEHKAGAKFASKFDQLFPDFRELEQLMLARE